MPSAYFTLLPALISLAFIPKRWATQRYFTWHAELLPHTEQVVLHKSFLFGSVDKYIVDIKNLERVSADVIGNPMVFYNNMYDQNMVFRCAET